MRLRAAVPWGSTRPGPRWLVVLIVALVSWHAHAGDFTSRPTGGLLALYTFQDGPSSLTSADIQPNGPSLLGPLTVGNTNRTAWATLSRGVQLQSPIRVQSRNNLTAILDAYAQQNNYNFTFEAWLTPAQVLDLDSSVIYPIVGFGSDTPVSGDVCPSKPSMMIAQQFDGVVFQMNNIACGGSVLSASTLQAGRAAHVVIRRANDAQIDIVVNNQLFFNSAAYRLANVPTGHRLQLAPGLSPWNGTVHLVSLWDRPLTGQEINTLYLAGLPNSPPVAPGGIAQAVEDILSNFSIPTYDFDKLNGFDLTPLTVTILSLPSRGRLYAFDNPNDPDMPLLITPSALPYVLSPNNTLFRVAYIGDPNGNGVAYGFLTYTVNDGQFLSAVGTLQLDVAPVNDPPVALPATFTGFCTLGTFVQLNGFDVDIPNITIVGINSAYLRSYPSRGLLYQLDSNMTNPTYIDPSSFNATSPLRVTNPHRWLLYVGQPAQAVSGENIVFTDSFQFSVHDEAIFSVAPSVITMQMLNTLQPLDTTQTYGLYEDLWGIVNLTAVNYSPNPFYFVIDSLPTHGTLRLAEYGIVAANTTFNPGSTAKAMWYPVGAPLTMAMLGVDGIRIPDNATTTWSTGVAATSLASAAPSLQRESAYVMYVANKDLNGMNPPLDAFSFRIVDATQPTMRSGNATQRLAVHPVNDPPVIMASPTSFVALIAEKGQDPIDTPFTVNVTDVDGEPQDFKISLSALADVSVDERYITTQAPRFTKGDGHRNTRMTFFAPLALVNQLLGGCLYHAVVPGADTIVVSVSDESPLGPLTTTIEIDVTQKESGYGGANLNNASAGLVPYVWAVVIAISLVVVVPLGCAIRWCYRRYQNFSVASAPIAMHDAASKAVMDGIELHDKAPTGEHTARASTPLPDYDPEDDDEGAPDEDLADEDDPPAKPHPHITDVGQGAAAESDAPYGHRVPRTHSMARVDHVRVEVDQKQDHTDNPPPFARRATSADALGDDGDDGLGALPPGEEEIDEGEEDEEEVDPNELKSVDVAAPAQ